MKTREYFQLTIIVILLLTQGCVNWDKNEYVLPDPEWSPEEVMTLAGNSFRDLHNVIQGDSSVALAMGVMADHFTCRWDNYGMRDLSLEPRVTSFDNSSENEYYFIIDNEWNKIYEVISEVNFVLERLYGGMLFGDEGEDNDMVETFCWFTCGVAHGYLGLIFDQAAVVEWDSDATSLSLVSWQDMIDESLVCLIRPLLFAKAGSLFFPRSGSEAR